MAGAYVFNHDEPLQLLMTKRTSRPYGGGIDWKMRRGEDIERSRGAPPKSLIHYPSMQYLKDKLKDSGDLLSYSFVQISVGMEKTTAAAHKEKR